MIDEGRVYTRGNSFRARAEADQRRFRAHVLKIESGKYGHWLTEEDGNRGMNFYGDVFDAMLTRFAQGKAGDITRAKTNMLASQAMCFNIFANLQDKEGLAVATIALRKLVPTIRAVRRIHLEYTPPNEVLGDQSGLGGVDCDVLVEYDCASGSGLLAIETKFVEEEFSTCKFRQRAAKGGHRLDVCQPGTCPRPEFVGCLYHAKKGYRYWQRSLECRTLKQAVLRGERPCPFSDGQWQLWVNHTLVHTEAKRRGATEAIFAVCAPGGNAELLKAGKTIDGFRAVLNKPSTMRLITLEKLFNALDDACKQFPQRRVWVAYLKLRYGVN
jgi:hypothetical protein